MNREKLDPAQGDSTPSSFVEVAHATVRHVMSTSAISIPATETVWTAIDLVRQHALLGIPVVDDGRIVGIVTPLQMLRQPLHRMVLEVMKRDITPAAPELSLVEAQLLFKRQQLDVLPVVEEGRLLGMISLTALLEAKSQDIDPLTGLPWSTALRAWAASLLAGGHELAILFTDLDNFHMVNRTHGHVVGDYVLRSIARRLADLVDPSTDMLCRYGGDEFAIATTRGGAQVSALAQRIQEGIVVPVEIDRTTLMITASVGVSGGRRVEKRAPAHIMATIEDLLTMASKASTLAKHSREVVGHQTTSTENEARRPSSSDHGEERLRLVGVTINASGGISTVSVELNSGTRSGVGSATGRIYGRGVLFLVAEATLQAIRQSLGENYTFALEDLTEIRDEGGGLIIAVLSGGSDTSDLLVGAARGHDLSHAVPKAILSALNCRLARSVGESVWHETPP